jgi:TRAP-type transport system periplasmic protein
VLRPLLADARPMIAAATMALVGLAVQQDPATAAEQWNFYMHQSAPNFATSRGAKMFTEEVEKATGGELKIRLHLAGTLQINASNITQAVGENVVQIGDDLFNSGNIAVAGIPRLPMLVQSYDDFAKADAILKPYIEKAFAQKGATVLASYTYPMQFVWGRKKLESLEDVKGMKLRVAQPEQGELVRRFGGVSITMSAPEVPSALDRGVPVLPRVVRPLYGDGLPDRKPRYDSDHRAANLSGVAELRYRSNLVRRRACAVCRAWTDFAADRY